MGRPAETLSSFMDGSCTKHGKFKEAERALAQLKLENLVPGNFETFEAVAQTLERRWGPPSSGKGRGAKHCPLQFLFLFTSGRDGREKARRFHPPYGGAWR